MKITRSQLRKLIAEHMIKPSIPNVPSAEAQGKIDDLARQEEFEADADSLAHAFKYPEDRSYSADLRSYDRIHPRDLRDDNIPVMKELGKEYAAAASKIATKGKPMEYYLKRKALIKAANICDIFYDYDMSLITPLIDAFTDGANDYERAAAARIGLQPRFNYRNYEIANDISIHSNKGVSLNRGGSGRIADLYQIYGGAKK